MILNIMNHYFCFRPFQRAVYNILLKEIHFEAANLVFRSGCIVFYVIIHIYCKYIKAQKNRCTYKYKCNIFVESDILTHKMQKEFIMKTLIAHIPTGANTFNVDVVPGCSFLKEYKRLYT